MKFRLTFLCGSPVSLPGTYNKILQAAILNWLGDEEYGTFLHDRGFQNEKRCFKLYTFSELEGKHEYDTKKRKLVFRDKIQLYLSFYTDESLPLILKNIEQRKPLCLGENLLELYDCEVVNEIYTDCVVKTVSPVTIHSTFELVDGRKKTYYYCPLEKDFSEMIRENLVRKYEAFYGVLPEDSEFKIIPEKREKIKETSFYYNRFFIKGWRGMFQLCGSEEMIRMALLAGIGARNGIGMGCVVQEKIV